ncbi:sodium:pantothenate symporter [Virgibacillus dakarensis]|uniref:Sodium:proline symporter n=1 Tax=Lentibacillus populi TaxID=1827502 RepID=A0A9W5TXF5_9BACI|nr:MULTISPECIES: sodium:pantothenate symporter [Bacillaceae]MTW85176.1 sodium:pantothenate symporter [Virgibacillus dakarensis]GGB43769.1 sodium:proline symporter [Lentibacillus populi]
MVSTYLWVLLIIFLLAMGYLSYISAKKTKTIEDFAISGANLGPYVLGLSFAATFFSAATFMGYPGYSYAWGYSNLWMFLGQFGGGALGIIVVGKVVRELNKSQKSLSLPDWLGDYYNSDFLRIGTGIIMLFNIFYIAAQFTAGAQIFSTMLDLSYHTGLIFIALIVMTYVFVGGSYADVYTDAVQAIIMAITGIVVFVSGIMIFGDGSITKAFTNITAKLASQDLNLVKVINTESGNYYAVSVIIAIFIIQFAFSSQPQLFNKVLSLKNPNDLRKMITTYMLTALLCLVVLFGGFYARAALPSIELADLALLEYVTWGMPAILAAVVGVVILAAALSTTDGIFVVISTVFSNDIYRKVLVKRGIVKADEEKSNRVALKISRWSVIVVGLIAYLIVLNPPKFMADLMWIGIAGVSSGTMGPLLYAVFTRKKASPRAAEISMVLGLLSYLIIYFGGFERSLMAAGAWATLVGIAIMWILATILKKPVMEKDQDVSKIF